jgi:Ni/Co efflux regulator RcnB
MKRVFVTCAAACLLAVAPSAFAAAPDQGQGDQHREYHQRGQGSGDANSAGRAGTGRGGGQGSGDATNYGGQPQYHYRQGSTGQVGAGGDAGASGSGRVKSDSGQGRSFNQGGNGQGRRGEGQDSGQHERFDQHRGGQAHGYNPPNLAPNFQAPLTPHGRPGAHWRDNSGRSWVWDGHANRIYGYSHRSFYRNWNWTYDRYRIGPYYRPHGWYYRRWVFGDFLPIAFFAETYRLYDYWFYNLPVPPYGCEWVRYGDDALLVDMRTGEVIQVIYGVFY